MEKNFNNRGYDRNNNNVNNNVETVEAPTTDVTIPDETGKHMTTGQKAAIIGGGVVVAAGAGYGIFRFVKWIKGKFAARKAAKLEAQKAAEEAAQAPAQEAPKA